jgi:cysteine desulfurase
VGTHFGVSSPREVVFTGSGSEAAALALIGAYLGREHTRRTTVVTSSIEHPCVLGARQRLAELGAHVVTVPTLPSGEVDLSAMMQALSDEVAVCSLMWVNNETGVIQPIAAVSRACVERGIVFHTDAVQAVGRLALNPQELPADLITFSAHKIGGPPGVGVLINRRNVDVAALVPGHQENGRRGGTQAVALAEGLALALKVSTAAHPVETSRLETLRRQLETTVLAGLPGSFVIGAQSPRVASTTSFCFPGTDGEGLLIALDLEGICVSTGAACASGSLTPSHVLLAMGLSPGDAHATIRVSLGWNTTEADVAQACAAIVRLVPEVAAQTLPLPDERSRRSR